MKIINTKRPTNKTPFIAKISGKGNVPSGKDCTNLLIIRLLTKKSATVSTIPISSCPLPILEKVNQVYHSLYGNCAKANSWYIPKASSKIRVWVRGLRLYLISLRLYGKTASHRSDNHRAVGDSFSLYLHLLGFLLLLGWEVWLI